MRGFAVLLLVGACSFPGSAAPDDGTSLIDGEPSSDDATSDGAVDGVPWLAGYTHRRRIDLLAPQGVALESFVLPVTLEDDQDLASVADDSAETIKFTLEDGTTLTPWEYEAYNGGEGDLVAWVRVPTMTAGKALYLYYGGAMPPDEPDVDTWDSSVYSLVMHFADPGNGPWQSATPDSDTMDVASGGPQRVDTLISTGRRFAGDDRIELGESGSERLSFGTRSFSFSVVVNSPANLMSWDMPLFKGGSSADTAGWDIELGSGPWWTCVSDGDNQGPNSIACADYVQDSVPLLGQWHLLSTVVDREAGELRAYVDGVLAQAVPLGNVGDVDTDTLLMISHPNHVFNGDMDELRVYDFATPEPWIATEHASIFAPETVRTIGGPESP